MIERIRQAWCGVVYGHNGPLEFGDHSVHVRCSRCSRLSPGIDAPDLITSRAAPGGASTSGVGTGGYASIIASPREVAPAPAPAAAVATQRVITNLGVFVRDDGRGVVLRVFDIPGPDGPGLADVDLPLDKLLGLAVAMMRGVDALSGSELAGTQAILGARYGLDQGVAAGLSLELLSRIGLAHMPSARGVQ